MQRAFNLRSRKIPITLTGFLFLTAITLTILFIGALPADGSTQLASGGPSPLFSFSGTLEAGDTIAPTFNSDQTAIFSLALSNGTGPVDLTISDSGGPVWSEQILADEMSWGTADLSGLNTFTLTNQDGGATVDFAFSLFAVPTVAYDWSGLADAAGINSEIQLMFPQAGLYEFDFTVSAAERYMFTLDDTTIQKMVSGPQTNSYYVAAGVHNIAIEQDGAGGDVDWSVAISYSGNSNDVTPFSQSGSSVDDSEVIPFNPAAAVQANLVFTATNATAELSIFDVNSNQIGSSRTIAPGETVWQSYDLPAGANEIVVDAIGGTLDYEFVLDALPGADGAILGGSSESTGVNSMARLNFADSGLYQFNFDVDSGRYQFRLDDEFIQKIAEEDGSVTYYVAQGIHELVIDQDTTAGADWQLTVDRVAGNLNSLPYEKDGADLGGPANDYSEEWLPIFLASSSDVNLHLEIIGGTTDSISISVYQGSSAVPSFTLTDAFGSEELWQTLPLAAGLNRIQVTASGNADSLAYDLGFTNIPQAGSVNWSGNALAAGANSVIQIEFPTTGLYRFSIESTEGFANLFPVAAVIEGQLLAPSGVISNSYDLQMSAGTHRILVEQDASYPETTWSATVAPIPAGPSFMTIDATLDGSESITQQFPGDMDFNFMVSAIGSDVEVEIIDGASSTIWNDDVFDSEIAWGTGTFAGDNEVIVTNTTGSSLDVTIVFYHIPSANDYIWDGLATDAGLNSLIRVNFPSDGLYTFDFGQIAGRYQFLVDADNLQKSVEGDSSVVAFMTSGIHELNIVQDSVGGADWDVTITNESTPLDSLPYAGAGTGLGANDFTEEWLPLELGTATAVNIEFQAIGSIADEISLEVHDINGLVAELSPVFGGETLWMTTDMPARAWLHVAADGGNGAELDYVLNVEAVPTATTAFGGQSHADNSEQSMLRVNFPSSGLYSFDLEATAGQFQFQLDDENILKTITGTTVVSYYVAAGIHEVTVIQDDTSAAMTSWTADISNVVTANDTLPYEKNGGAIGTVFAEEWLPIALAEATVVNMRIGIDGADTDAVTVEIRSGVTVVESFQVSGTEIVWRAIEMPTNAHIHLDASGAAGVVNYEILVEAVGTPGYSWSGTSLSGGAQPTFLADIAVTGLYQVVVTSHEGFINFTHSEYPAPTIRAGIVVTSEVNFDAGMYQFTGTPSGSLNKWETEITLLQAEAPTVTTISPDHVFFNQGAEVTISGTFFWLDTVELVNGLDRHTLVVTDWSETSITATVAKSLPIGTYDVVVTNMDAQTAELSSGFVVEMIRVYLPVIFN